MRRKGAIGQVVLEGEAGETAVDCAREWERVSRRASQGQRVNIPEQVPGQRRCKKSCEHGTRQAGASCKAAALRTFTPRVQPVRPSFKPAWPGPGQGLSYGCVEIPL